MKRRARTVFNEDGTVSIVTTRKGKPRAKKFTAVSAAVNYCRENRIIAYLPK